MNETTNDKEACEKALDHLHDVLDPEVGINIVDLGLIYQIDFDHEEKMVFCTMTLTTQFCPMGESITDGTNQCLKMNFPGYTIGIDLIFDPPWDMSKISPEGQQQLNGY